MARGRGRGLQLNEQGRKAQAECLRANGLGECAEAVEKGQVEFDPDWLEMGCPEK